MAFVAFVTSRPTLLDDHFGGKTGQKRKYKSCCFFLYFLCTLFEKLKKEKKLKVNDKYFEKLHAQFDITKADSYCEHVSGKMLIFLRFLGFSLSYITIYISRPKRIYKLLKSVFQKKFFADNLFEQRLYEFYLRTKLKKQQKS